MHCVVAVADVCSIYIHDGIMQLVSCICLVSEFSRMDVLK